jgi:serralysin
MATQTNSIPGTGYGNTYIDSLVWGCGWTGGPITYAFGSGSVPAADSSIGAFTGAAWTPAQEAAFQTALDQYASVCNLTFAAAATPADANIVWWLAPQSVMGAGTLGMHEVPDATVAPIYGYFNYQDSTWSNLQPGSIGFVTIIHELGHAMGLAHPHDGGDHADATIFPGVTGPWSIGTAGLNQGIWTTMSYNDGWSQAPSPSTVYGAQATLMAFDVAALQTLYGANTATRTGDDTYTLPSATGPGSAWSCVWDAGGVDTITNAGSTKACTINLNDAPLTGAAAGGYVSRDVGVIGGFTIAHGATIENAVGGGGNDTLVGNAAANVLDGGAGSDTMTGGAGGDIYVVDSARDKVTELAGQGADSVWSAVGYKLGSNLDNLRLTGIANIAATGNSLDNMLEGNAGKNTLSGGDGADVLDGGAGVDRLTGGRGADVFRFESGDTGVGSGLRDVVTDFKAADGDRVDLTAIDANTSIGGVQPFAFIGSVQFSAHAGELRFQHSVLSGDVDGDGSADFEIQLTGLRTFDATMLAH